jgi:hypothetical protein
MKKLSIISLLLIWFLPSAQAGFTIHPSFTNYYVVTLTAGTNDQIYANLVRVLTEPDLNPYTNNPSLIASNSAYITAVSNSAVIPSGTRLAWSTNSQVLNNTNGTRWTLPYTFTNFASLSFSNTGTVTVNWSTNSGTSWSNGYPAAQLGTNLTLSFLTSRGDGSIGAAYAPTLYNVKVYAISNTNRFNWTNDVAGQVLRVTGPVIDADAAPKGYVDRAVAAVVPGSYSGRYATITGVNAYIDPGTGFYYIDTYTPTNGLNTNSLAVQYAYLTNLTQWFDSGGSQTISVDETNYLVQLFLPSFFVDSTMALRIRIGQPFAPIPTIAYTVPAATSSTWGYGAGMLLWDANYIYISTATNQWKRAALSTW